MSRPTLDLRTDADREEERELQAIALELKNLGDPRMFALDVVRELVEQLGTGEMPALLGEPYQRSFADIRELLLAGSEGRMPTGIHVGNLSDVHALADRLSSRFFAKVGHGGTWPFELRAPFEVANALRRACEPFHMLRLILPLIVRDARSLLTQAHARPERITDLIAEASRPC